MLRTGGSGIGQMIDAGAHSASYFVGGNDVTNCRADRPHDKRSELPVEDLLNSLAVGTAVLEAVQAYPDVPPEMLTLIERALYRLHGVALALQSLTGSVESAAFQSTRAVAASVCLPHGQGERKGTTEANDTLSPDAPTVRLDEVPGYE